MLWLDWTLSEAFLIYFRTFYIFAPAHTGHINVMRQRTMTFSTYWSQTVAQIWVRNAFSCKGPPHNKRPLSLSQPAAPGGGSVRGHAALRRCH